MSKKLANMTTEELRERNAEYMRQYRDRKRPANLESTHFKLAKTTPPSEKTEEGCEYLTYTLWLKRGDTHVELGQVGTGHQIDPDTETNKRRKQHSARAINCFLTALAASLLELHLNPDEVY